jgi:CBS domain containing-hemolysin-like protein
MTLAILILSEIVPKTIGALHWQKLAKFTVFSLRFLIIALAPLVWMGQLVTRSLKKDSDKPILTRNDFLAMAEMGAQDGVFDADESQMIGSMIRFQSIQVRDIMTPRTVVSAVSQEQSITNYYQHRKENQFSRIPTYSQDNKDQITGYIIKIDVAEAIIEGDGDALLTSLRRDIVAVGETLAVTELFTNLMERREHVAVVLDDFGGMAGIVTMEDLIETILGMEIMDETDTATDMRILAQKHREKRAKALGVLDPEPSD